MPCEHTSKGHIAVHRYTVHAAVRTGLVSSGWLWTRKNTHTVVTPLSFLNGHLYIFSLDFFCTSFPCMWSGLCSVGGAQDSWLVCSLFSVGHGVALSLRVWFDTRGQCCCVLQRCCCVEEARQDHRCGMINVNCSLCRFEGFVCFCVGWTHWGVQYRHNFYCCTKVVCTLHWNAYKVICYFILNTVLSLEQI